MGNAILIEDAEGRYTAYEYNLYGEVTAIVVDPVTWDDGSGPVTLNANGEALTYTYAYAYAYDDLGRLVSASEVDGSSASVGADYDYTYDLLGRVTELVADLDGLTPDVTFDQTYDSLGNRTEVAVTVGSTLGGWPRLLNPGGRSAMRLPVGVRSSGWGGSLDGVSA